MCIPHKYKQTRISTHVCRYRMERNEALASNVKLTERVTVLATQLAKQTADNDELCSRMADRHQVRGRCCRGADDAAEPTAKAFARNFQWSPRSETPLTEKPPPQLLDANEAAIRDKEWIGSLYTQSRNTERQLFKENEALSLQLVDLKQQHQGLLQENEALRLETADLKDDVESLQIEVEALRNELEQAGKEEGDENTEHSQEVVDGGQEESDVEERMNRFQRVETREVWNLLHLENQQISTVGNVCERAPLVCELTINDYTGAHRGVAATQK